MKVAMYTTVGNLCGIAQYTRELVAALDEFADVVVEPIEPGRQSDEHYHAQADRLNQADVVHIQHEHSFWGGILPGHSAFWTIRYLIRKPVVVTAHTTTSLAKLLKVRQERRPIHRIAKELLLLRRRYRDSVETAPFVTARCIVHTEEGRQELIARGARPQFLHLIPAGVPNVPPARTGGRSFREKYDLGESRLLALFGFLSPNKGIELTLQVLQELPTDVRLVLAGGVRTADAQPYADAVRRRIDEMRLRDRVTITGYLSDDDVAEAMAAAEVVLVPHTEATGSYSVMIGLAHGRPLVTSDLACFREIQARVPCLRLFRSGDAAHYAACLRGVLANEVGRAEMAARARQYAEQYSWREVARRTADVYAQALADAERPIHG